MQTIANTPHYTLAVDPSKNRIYWTPRGLWDQSLSAPKLVDQWERARRHVLPGFTILADARQIQILSADWADTFEQIQELMISSGLAASAEVLPEDAITKMQAKRISRQSGMRREVFASVEEAEKWLDSLRSLKHAHDEAHLTP